MTLPDPLQSNPNTANGKNNTLFIAACIVFIIVQGIYSASINSVTADEYVHLPVAISILQTRDIVMDHAGSPPLRAALALPALAASPVMDYKSQFWSAKRSYQFSWQFMRDNFSKYHSLFMLSRMSSVLVAVLLCLTVCASASSIFGARAAPFAAFLFCMNPEVMAHSSLTTVDMLAACFFFMSFHCLSKFIAAPDRNNAIALGFSTGLALLAKYTCAIIPPLHVILIILFLLTSANARIYKGKLISLYLLSIAISLTVLCSGFMLNEPFTVFSSHQWRSALFQSVAASPISRLPVPFPWLYLDAIDQQLFNRNMFTYYFRGELSRTGWASYYWFAMLIKTPVPLLLCAAAAIASAFRKSASFAERSLWLAPSVFMLAFTLHIRIDMGIRYLLPIVPFIIVASSGLLGRLSARGSKHTAAALVICVAYMLSTLQTFGNGLAYFNEIAGGPGGGHRYIVESNLDWGQNLVRLKNFVDKENPSPLLVYNYGLVPPAAYGINNAGWVPCEPTSAVVAISINYLKGVDPFQHRTKECFSWLLTKQPVTILGHGLYVFDFRNNH